MGSTRFLNSYSAFRAKRFVRDSLIADKRSVSRLNSTCAHVQVDGVRYMWDSDRRNVEHVVV